MPVKGLQRRKSAAEILVERGLLDADKAKLAQADAAKTGRAFQQSALELKFVEKGPLLKTLSEEWEVKAVDLAAMGVDAETAKIIPEAVARRHSAVPFAKEENVLFVAMADPRDFFVAEDIQLRTGLDVQPYLALPQDVLAALDAAYGRGEGAALSRLMTDVAAKTAEAQADGELQVQKDGAKADITEVDASAPEVEKFVNAIILGALSMKASDIHIEPFEDPAGRASKILLRYRVDGRLIPGPFTVPWSYRFAVAAKIKIMTNSMNITERRVPQSGRIQILAQGNPIEFRVEMVPTVYGESCVMRILDRKSVQVDIMKMGFLDDTLARLLGLLKGIGGKKNFGLVLVCGPTGSGKSTTLYAALNHVNRPDIKILTAENPVEYNLDGIVQVPVNPEIKLGDKTFDFATALRSFLRLDPDVIMVGEIRDEETAHIAMEAAMTGHLVFSTIHTNDAPSAVSRLTDMGLPAFMVASTVKAILAQRLSRRLCSECKVAREATPEERAVFKDNAVELAADAKVFGPPPSGGCDSCKGLGYRGRVGLHELLVMSDALRLHCLKDVSAETVRAQARSEGMRLIVQDGLEKVKLGLTTVREVLGGTD